MIHEDVIDSIQKVLNRPVPSTEDHAFLCGWYEEQGAIIQEIINLYYGSLEKDTDRLVEEMSNRGDYF